MHQLIISILADDKPGLVKQLSDVLNTYGSNWSDSRMSHLAGKFAGILQVSVGAENKQALLTALKSLESSGFQLLVDESNEANDTSLSTVSLAILGQDRPGIIHDISTELSRLGVNIESLESLIRPASMSGELLFDAKLEISMPEDLALENVISTLEGMSDQLMIDINIET